MVNRETVQKISELANLQLEADEATRMREELNRILEFVEALKSFDIPSRPKEKTYEEIELPLREDRVCEFSGDDLLALAPSRRRRYFEVPAVIEEE